MADRPILMSAPMVRGLIAGTKSQTRRPLSAENLRIWNGGLDYAGTNVKWPKAAFEEMLARNARDFRLIDGVLTWVTDPTPYQGPGRALWQGRLVYVVGDCLWVKETFATTDGGPVRYAATDDTHELRKKKPSIFMPMWASRLTLEITDVRIERLQEISEADAIAEGIWTFIEGNSRPNEYAGVDQPEDRLQVIKILYGSPQNAYRHLWESINGADSWDKNPFVVAVSFRPHLTNIDAFLKQREAA